MRGYPFQHTEEGLPFLFPGGQMQGMAQDDQASGCEERESQNLLEDVVEGYVLAVHLHQVQMLLSPLPFGPLNEPLDEFPPAEMVGAVEDVHAWGRFFLFRHPWCPGWYWVCTR